MIPFFPYCQRDKVAMENMFLQHAEDEVWERQLEAFNRAGDAV